MPGDDEEPLSTNLDPSLLSADEIGRLVDLFVKLGVRKVRLTGGEPTIRSDIGQILAHLGDINARLPEPLSLGITTNGVRLKRLLPQLRAAGMRGINISLDTLAPAKFPLIARRPAKWHARVLEAVDAISQDDFFKLKLNCVMLRGVNEDEIGDFINLTESRKIEVRFLEFMPFDRNGWSEGRMVPQADILEGLQKHLDGRGVARAQRLPPESLNDVATLWQVPGWRGRLGVIASMTDAFCGGCNRLRMTSDGQLRNCLFGEEGWSLRDALRSGDSDEAIAALIGRGMAAKYAKLGGKRDMHELRERDTKGLPMVALGG